ncbi:hypothetical protein, partial [Pseudoflavonifractor phocaeensis]|uniref:hypothetical protein n=1 Tax=Pseudoflavonifractor phocaeensis TaxID=1870988 RepID=UPI001957D1C3
KGLVLALPNIRNFFAFHWIFGLDRQFSSVIISIFAPQYGVQNQILCLVCALRIAAQGDARHTFGIVPGDRGSRVYWQSYITNHLGMALHCKCLMTTRP